MPTPYKHKTHRGFGHKYQGYNSVAIIKDSEFETLCGKYESVITLKNDLVTCEHCKKQIEIRT